MKAIEIITIIENSNHNTLYIPTKEREHVSLLIRLGRCFPISKGMAKKVCMAGNFNVINSNDITNYIEPLLNKHGFTGDYKPTKFETSEELLKKLEEDYKTGKTALKKATNGDLKKNWKITSGEIVFADYTKYEAIRHALNQITHHRAQLGVYYRLNDIELPSSYGPSADSSNF